MRSFRGKAATIICALLLCFLTVVSCGGCGLIFITRTGADESAPVSDSSPALTDAPTPVTTAKVPDIVDFSSRIEKAQEALDDLYDVDVSSYDLMLCAAAEADNTISPGESSPIYAACSLRNKMVFEKYECGFFNFTLPLEQLTAELSASVRSGADKDYFADILLLPESSAVSLRNAGLLMDLRRLPFYTVSTTGNAGAGNYISSNYFDISAAGEDPASFYALFFNRTLAGNELTDSLYKAAREKNLTWETFLTAVRSYPSDASLDNVCVSIGDSDAPEYLADIVCIRSGVDFMTDSSGSVPGISWNDENSASVTATLTELSALLGKETASAESFAEGKTLFRFAPLSDILKLYDKKVEWGLLPLPESADGAPAAVTSSSRNVLCVPANNSRTELTGLLLTAFDVASKDWIRDQFALICVERYMRDNASCLNLKSILEDEIYRDFSYIFSPSVAKLSDATFGAAENCLLTGTPIADSVKAVRATVEKNLKKVY